MIDDRTDDRACGADDVVLPAVFRKLRFKMITDRLRSTEQLSGSCGNCS